MLCTGLCQMTVFEFKCLKPRLARASPPRAKRLLGSEMQHLALAAFQGQSKNGDVSFNLKRMKEQMNKASAVGAEMILFPELFLSGYCVPAEQMKKMAEERNGPSFQELSKAAKEANIAVLYGYPEVDRSSGSEVFYNSAQLIDKDGSALANYRKTHMWIDDMGYEKVFKAGNAFEEIVNCCGVKIGILICFDIEFPECARGLALKGAKFIAVPTAISCQLPLTIQEKVPNLVVPARALENRIYLVSVNHGGENFSGHSTCCSPTGDCVVQAGCEEQLVLFSIDPNFTPEHDFLSQRRPDMYGNTCVQ